jgi:hypothetical protein
MVLRLRGDRRGFPARAGSFDPAVARIGGRARKLRATFCGMSAGWIVVRIAKRVQPPNDESNDVAGVDVDRWGF